MEFGRRGLIIGGGMAALSGSAGRSRAASGAPIRIGVLTDMTSQYSDLNGRGSVVAAQLAADDAGGVALGRPVQLLVGDMQGKIDIGLTIAHQWYDADGIELIIDVPNSGLALAVQDLARDRNRLMIVTASSSDITGARCVPNGLQWGGTSYTLGVAPARLILESGGDTWFFITVDYAFGISLERDTTAAVQKGGGRVVGAVRHPLNTTDFSSYLLQAQASGAKVIAFANTGENLNNSMKQASEFGLTSDHVLVGLAQSVTNLHSVGLATAPGTLFTSPWYWDANDESRAFSRRWSERMGSGAMPDRLHVANYSIVSQYLKAVNAAGSTETNTVLAKLHAMPVDDVYTHGGRVQANGALSFDWFVLKSKTPQTSHGPWDLAEIVKRIPADQAVLPAAESGCKLAG